MISVGLRGTYVLTGKHGKSKGIKKENRRDGTENLGGGVPREAEKWKRMRLVEQVRGSTADRTRGRAGPAVGCARTRRRKNRKSKFRRVMAERGRRGGGQGKGKAGLKGGEPRNWTGAK